MNHSLEVLIFLTYNKCWSWTRSLVFAAKGSSIRMSCILSPCPIDCEFLAGWVLVVSPAQTQSWVCACAHDCQGGAGPAPPRGTVLGSPVWVRVLCKILFNKSSSPDKFYPPFNFKSIGALSQPLRDFDFLPYLCWHCGVGMGRGAGQWLWRWGILSLETWWSRVLGYKVYVVWGRTYVFWDLELCQSL